MSSSRKYLALNITSIYHIEAKKQNLCTFPPTYRSSSGIIWLCLFFISFASLPEFSHSNSRLVYPECPTSTTRLTTPIPIAYHCWKFPIPNHSSINFCNCLHFRWSLIQEMTLDIVQSRCINLPTVHAASIILNTISVEIWLTPNRDQPSSYIKGVIYKKSEWVITQAAFIIISHFSVFTGCRCRLW